MIVPSVSWREYRDGFENICTRIVAPAGSIAFRTNFYIQDSGQPDAVMPSARQHPIEELTDDVLFFCWAAGTVKLKSWLTSRGGLLAPQSLDGSGCRRSAISSTIMSTLDIATLEMIEPRSIRFIRCMSRLCPPGGCPVPLHEHSRPVLYCYLGDVGVPPDPAPMDFNAWFEAFLGERWYTFDPRHNRPRTGRILIARGRDAADVAIATSFGSATLTRFNVVTEEVAMASSLQKRA